MNQSNKMKKLVSVFIVIIAVTYLNSAEAANPPANRARGQSTTTVRSNIQEHSSRDDINPLHAATMNPVARLYLIRAKQHQTEPVFKEIARKHYRNEKNHIIRHEFQIQVKIDDKTASAWGPTKKEAKRKAATVMLTQMNLNVTN